MRLLRRGTTIPVEEMFSFSTDCDNELDWPFILMEFIKGRSLEDIWFDKVSSKEVVQERCARSLKDIVSAFVQLGKYSFEQGGTVVFDDQDQMTGVESFKIMIRPLHYDVLRLMTPTIRRSSPL